MSLKSKELREKYAKLVTEAQAVLAKETNTPEERTAVTAQLNEAEQIKAQFEQIEAVDKAAAELRATKHTGEATKHLSNDSVERAAQVKKAFRDLLRNGNDRMSQESRSILAEETRTYTPLITTNEAAGDFVPPGFSNEFDEALKQTGGMLATARTYATDSGNSLIWPMSDDTSNAAVIVGEGTTTQFANPTVTKVTLNSFMYTSAVQASVQQIQDSAFDIEGWIRGELALRLSRKLNSDFTIGAGTTLPFGVVTKASAGVTSVHPTSLTYDDLVAHQHSVDPAYRNGAKWMFNDATLQAVRLIKDSYGRPIFSADPNSAGPATILGHQYVINQDVASIAAGAVPVIFGDFSKYVIRKVNGLSIMVLRERYAELGLVGYILWARYDGNLTTASTKAITKLTCSAS